MYEDGYLFGGLANRHDQHSLRDDDILLQGATEAVVLVGPNLLSFFSCDYIDLGIMQNSQDDYFASARGSNDLNYSVAVA